LIQPTEPTPSTSTLIQPAEPTQGNILGYGSVGLIKVGVLGVGSAR
jgi:hypothetical protein